MASRTTELDGQPTAESTPEDVTALYSWANLQGAKYRDYSASRREYRAQVRYRAAKALLDRELKAQEDAEANAVEAEQLAQEAETTAQRHSDNSAGRIQSQRIAEAAARKASAERIEAARRAETAARAAVLAFREEREIVDAHSSATRKQFIYEESELRRRELAGPQPQPSRSSVNPAPSSFTQQETLQQFLQARLPELAGASASISNSHLNLSREPAPFAPQFSAEAAAPPVIPLTAQELQRIAAAASDDQPSPSVPAWLYASNAPPRPHVSPAILPPPRTETAAADTLQDSRERVAARWFVLKDVFATTGPELPAMPPIRTEAGRTRLLAAFSLAGGAGKSSLIAALGRALATEGEKVLLMDTTSLSLLPVYFGVPPIIPGEVRTLSESDGSASPISLAVHDVSGSREDERRQKAATEQILRSGQGSQRLLLDIAAESSWLLRRLVDLHPLILVPLAPDMNSVFSLQAIEKFFRSFSDSEGRSLRPFYVLNHFDATLPLHLDVREVLRRQLGDRLLPTAIRQSPAVSEALAQGMTVLDYAPTAPVSHDYLDVAAWLRGISPAAPAGPPSLPRSRQ